MTTQDRADVDWRLMGLVILTSLMFGNNFVALAVALRDAGPITVQACASSVAAAAAFAATRADKRTTRRLSKSTVVAVITIGLVLSTASPILIVFGVERVSPGVVSMLVATAPIITLVLSRLVLRTPMVGVQATGVFLGLVGVGLIVAPYGFGGGTEMTGALLVVGGAVCWATGLVLTRRMPGAVGGGRFVAWQLVAGLPVLWPLAIITEGAAIVWTLGFLAGVVYSGAVAKGLASVLQYRIVRRGSPLYSSVSAFLVPAVGVVSSWVLLDEPVAPIQLLGGLVVVAAAFTVMRSQSRTVAAAPAESA